MIRYILIFGAIAGTLVGLAAGISMQIVDPADAGFAGIVGYLVMLVLLSILFVGIKRYRDQQCGGVIRFAHALGVGAAMSVIAAIFYALAWEAYTHFADFDFAAQYSQGLIASINASDISAAEKASKIADVEAAMQLNRNPAFRLLISATEILPVALLVSLVSAFILKNRKALPAREAI